MDVSINLKQSDESLDTKLFSKVVTTKPCE